MLAAGFGTRLWPLSLQTPKPLVPLWGRPVIRHVLGMLADWGVREALVNLHFQPGPIVRELRSAPVSDLTVSFSFEPEILGTGGVLRKADWFLGNEPFWMMNADVAADLDPTPLLRAFADRRALAALWLEPEFGPRTVEMRDGRITNFETARPETDGTYTFCGLQLLSPDILRYIPGQGFSSIIRAYNLAMRDGRAIAGVAVPGSFWEDIGTPDFYLRAHARALAAYRARRPGARLYDPASARRAALLARDGARVAGFVACGRNVSAAAGAVIENSVLWDGARLGPGAVVRNAVVAAGTRVDGEVRRVAVPMGSIVEDAPGGEDQHLAQALARLGWPAQSSTMLPLEPRGSARVFARLRWGRRRAMMIRYSLDRSENAFYAQHARFLKSLGLRVPDILVDMPAARLLVIEDLGDHSLLDAASAAEPARLIGLYSAVLDKVLLLHSRGATAARRRGLAMVPSFSPDLYRWEREFFARHFLARRLGPGHPAIAGALADLARVARRLLGARHVLVHRDLQSTNILLTSDGPAFIDFQGMRFGPAAYDLASLLCDPYVELPLPIQDRLWDYYARKAGWTRKDRGLFWWAAIERLAQALGAFGRLGANPETARFARHIEPGLRMMRRALERVDGLPRLNAAVEAAAGA